MANGSFSSALTAWARKTKNRMLVVFRTAAQDVATESRLPVASGGNMPVLTGNLRRSQVASLTSMPTTKEGKDLFKDDPGQAVSLVIAQAHLGDTVYIGFQAHYARYVEPRYGFIRLTAQRWPQIVKRAAEKVQAGFEGGGRGG